MALDSFIGEIALFSFDYDYAPEHWAPCDGRSLHVLQFPALHAVIGNKYGGNHENQTFNLPDLRGKVVVSAGELETKRGNGKTFVLGETNGNQQTTCVGKGHAKLEVDHLPKHTHDLKTTIDVSMDMQKVTATTLVNIAISDSADATTPSGNFISTTGGLSSGGNAIGATATTSLEGMATASAVLLGKTDGITNADSDKQKFVEVSFRSEEFSIMQPYMVLNYCICINGIYPNKP